MAKRPKAKYALLRHESLTSINSFFANCTIFQLTFPKMQLSKCSYCGELQCLLCNVVWSQADKRVWVGMTGTFRPEEKKFMREFLPTCPNMSIGQAREIMSRVFQSQNLPVPNPLHPRWDYAKISAISQMQAYNTMCKDALLQLMPQEELDKRVREILNTNGEHEKAVEEARVRADKRRRKRQNQKMRNPPVYHDPPPSYPDE